MKAQLDSNGGIIWAEERIEKEVRTIIGKPGGVIMPSDLDSIISFTWTGGNGFDNVSLVDVVYFKKLTELTVDRFCGDTGALASMTTLTKLTLLNTIRDSDLRYLSGLSNLTYLAFGLDTWLTNISPLATLTELNVRGNSISDISPLVNLTKLTTLELQRNDISDLSRLSGLINLTELDVSSNIISDISPLSGLTNLTELNLKINRITDVSALSNLKKLNQLDLVGYYEETNQIRDWTLLHMCPM